MYGGYFGQFSGLKVEEWPSDLVRPPAFPNYIRRKTERYIGHPAGRLTPQLIFDSFKILNDVVFRCQMAQASFADSKTGVKK